MRGASDRNGAMAVHMVKLAGAAVLGTFSGKNLNSVSGLGADEVLDYSK